MVTLAATWQLHGGWGPSAGLGSNEEAGHEVGTRRGRCDTEKGLSLRAIQEVDPWKLVDRDSGGHRDEGQGQHLETSLRRGTQGDEQIWRQLMT